MGKGDSPVCLLAYNTMFAIANGPNVSFPLALTLRVIGAPAKPGSAALGPDVATSMTVAVPPAAPAIVKVCVVCRTLMTSIPFFPAIVYGITYTALVYGAGGGGGGGGGGGAGGAGGAGGPTCSTFDSNG